MENISNIVNMDTEVIKTEDLSAEGSEYESIRVRQFWIGGTENNINEFYIFRNFWIIIREKSVYLRKSNKKNRKLSNLENFPERERSDNFETSKVPTE